jgi:hypothetical protein
VHEDEQETAKPKLITELVLKHLGVHHPCRCFLAGLKKQFVTVVPDPVSTRAPAPDQYGRPAVCICSGEAPNMFVTQEAEKAIEVCSSQRSN